MFNTQTIVDPSKPQSEDIVGVSENAAWVIDGSDGRGDIQFSDDSYYSDGVWYVDQLSTYFENHLDDTTRTLRDHVEDGIRHVADKYADLHGQDPEDIDPMIPPAGALSIVRWRMDSLEYYNLADCSIIVETPEERDIHIRDAGPRPFDARLNDIVNTEDNDATPSRDEFLREQFRNRNTPDAYYVASLDPHAAYNGLQGRIPLDEVKSVLMFSDGIERLVENYGVYDSWSDARDAVREGGVDELIDQLRHIEYDVDPEGEQYPRTKQADDASTVFVTPTDD